MSLRHNLFGVKGKAHSAAKAVLQASDLTYLGLFRLPASNGTDVRLEISTGALSGRTVGGQTRLFVTGRDRWETPAPAYGNVYEVAYPGDNALSVLSPSASVESAVRASLVGTNDNGGKWGDVNGSRRIVQNGEESRCWGIHFDGTRLWWVYNVHYSANDYPFLGFTALNIDGTTTSYGPWKANAHSGRLTASPMTIPQWFADAYMPGKTLVVGGPTHNQNANSAWGANLQAFVPPTESTPVHSNPADTASYELTLQPLVWHDMAHPQARGGSFKTCGYTVYPDHTQGGPITTPDMVFGGKNPGPGTGLLDWMESACWIDTDSKHGVLFLGQLVDTVAGGSYGTDTVTHNWYGSDYCPHGQTGVPGFTTGPHSATLANQSWIYDPMDFVSVLQGANPWSLSPHSTFRASAWANFAAESRTSLYQFGGMYFDRESSRLFVAERNRDTAQSDPQSVIHVFQVN